MCVDEPKKPVLISMDEFWDAASVSPRPRRGRWPVQISDEPVNVRGDALHPIWWRGRQWAVTAYGLEALNGQYSIEANRIAEDIADFGWPQLMNIKTWPDMDDFNTAWMVAIALHGIEVPGGSLAIREAIKRVVPLGNDT